MKKLKKIVLKKEIVTSLSSHEQSHIKGGDTGLGCALWSVLLSCFCGGGGKKEDDGDGYDGPNTGIEDCPDHSAVDSGCDAETCGWAYTCNGR
jgi:natural product precursor